MSFDHNKNETLPPYVLNDRPPSYSTNNRTTFPTRLNENKKTLKVVAGALLYLAIFAAFVTMIRLAPQSNCEELAEAQNHFENCICQPTSLVLLENDMVDARTLIFCPSKNEPTIENIISSKFNRTDVAYSCLYAQPEHKLTSNLYSDLGYNNDHIAQFSIYVKHIWWTQVLTWCVFLPVSFAVAIKSFTSPLPFILGNFLFVVLSIGFSVSPCILI